MYPSFRVRTGIVPGRYHIFSNINCQDAYEVDQVEIDGNIYTLGVISDGCGQGKHSGVGASLTTRFVMKELYLLLTRKVAFSAIPNNLYQRIIRWLRKIVGAYSFSTPKDYVDFIKNHLLFTIIGFIQGPESTVVFASGDGLVMINNEVDFRQENNKPYYIAYHLIDPKYLATEASKLPISFEVYSIPTEEFIRLAIGSDAWEQEKDLILFNQIWGITHPNGLQRKMNIWSKKRHRFIDDATLIVLERQTG